MSDGPPVTLSDPNNPGEPVDVMVSGDEREPWKPGRRTWSVLGVLALIAAMVVLVSLVVQHRDEQASKDAATLSQFALVSPVRLPVPLVAEPQVDHGRVGRAVSFRLRLRDCSVPTGFAQAAVSLTVRGPAC